jgi:Reverse transcriptase (RNA-dependent DNA polymerase)
MGSKLVQMLLYADDMVLLARSPQQLQQQLRALHTWAGLYAGMEVNVDKTEVVVFRKASQPRETTWQWQYGGSPLKVSEEFRYLGIIFHETRGVSAAIDSLATAARRAMWAMISRFRVARITDISMKLSMFSALVLPILEYCGEVWGPALLSTTKELKDLWAKPLQRVQTLFLRQMGSLRKSVATTVLHRELCQAPVAKGWMRASCALWQRLRAAPANSLLGAAARDSIRLAQASALGAKRSWAGQFLGMLRNLLGPCNASGEMDAFVAKHGVCTATDSLLPLPSAEYWEAWDSMLEEPWQEVEGENPRTTALTQHKLATYAAWFDIPKTPAAADGEREGGYPMGMPRYVCKTGGIPFEHVKSLMRLRTGAHHLAIETGRWQRVNRDERLCPKCTSGVGEDELHVLFECPFYDEIRTKFSAPLFAQFGGPGGVASVMQHQWYKCAEFMEQEPRYVARYVHECLQKRRYEDAPVGPGGPAVEVGVQVGAPPPQDPDPAILEAPAVGASAPQGSETVYYSAISSDFVDQSEDDSDTASVSGGRQRHGVSVISSVAHGALVGSSRAPL